MKGILRKAINIMNIAIYGYGNLGRAAELAINANSDMNCFGVFTRRDPSAVKTYGAPVYSAADILNYKDDIDLVFIAGGSATDLPEMTPALAKNFNVIDSYDNHSSIPKHFANVDVAAKEGGNIALISAGWDPGMFSIARIYQEAALPKAKSYTFWGKGVSQGHSDAVRRIKGVLDARQYTIPVDAALDAVRSGQSPEFTARQMHLRDVYVVAEEGADLARIENEIKTMPAYFEPYDTTVHFISAEEMKTNHSGLPHGGIVIRSGSTGKDKENNHVMEFSLKLDSNPEFTANVIISFARAIMKMHAEGETGCRTVFDVPPKYLVDIPYSELIAHML